jgi:ribosomal 30S subunit maturation factor RimM
VLVVQDDEKKTEQLIPFVLDEIVLEVDLDAQCIRVDWELDY